MCRHLLQHLAGGPFPVARYSAAARNNKRQVRRYFPLFLAFWSCPIDRCSPSHKSLSASGRPIGGDRGPRTLKGWAIRMGQSASWAMGNADSACRLTGARRNFTGKDQRPCSIGNDQMWLRRVVTLLFRTLTAGLDRMTVDTAWAPPGSGSWPQDGRSVAM